MDINRADTQFDNQHSFHGYQWRTQYIKDIPETNTNIAVSYYRYTNDGYFSFDEANTRNWDYNSRQKSEIQFNISQTIFDGVSLYASGSQQDYWGNNGFAPIFPDICYHLTHYKPAAADIPVASDNPAHYADAIRYNARTPLQGSLLPLTRLVWA